MFTDEAQQAYTLMEKGWYSGPEMSDKKDKFCILGAILRVAKGSKRIQIELSCPLYELLPAGSDSLMCFNDSHTKEDVLALCRTAWNNKRVQKAA